MSARKPDKRRALPRDREFIPKPSQTEPDPALSSSERNMRTARDLIGGQAAPVREDDRLPLSLGQLAERLANFGSIVVALGQHGGMVVHPGLLGGAGDDLQAVGRPGAHL